MAGQKGDGNRQCAITSDERMLCARQLMELRSTRNTSIVTKDDTESTQSQGIKCARREDGYPRRARPDTMTKGPATKQKATRSKSPLLAMSKRSSTTSVPPPGELERLTQKSVPPPGELERLTQKLDDAWKELRHMCRMKENEGVRNVTMAIMRMEDRIDELKKKR